MFMEQRPCIFCGIARKQVPAKIVYEDENSVSFLDINPRSKGMCVVVPKQHYQDFDENFDVSFKVFQAALIVAEMIKQSLQPETVFMAMMKSEMVPHFHVKVYPAYKDQMPLMENQPMKATEEELAVIAEKMKAVRVEFKQEKPKEEVIEERPEEEAVEKKSGRSKEEVDWIKRQMDLA